MYGATLQLAKKCVKTLVRQRSVVLLVALSTFVVYGSLMVAWWLSRNNFRTIMSSHTYASMKVEMTCSAEKSSNLYSDPVKYVSNECTPSNPSSNQDMSLAELILGLLNSPNVRQRSTDENVMDIGNVLASIIMNGIPLLGLDDFVYFSDYFNHYLGKKTGDTVMSLPVFEERFHNFLLVRKIQLRVTGDCWKHEFIEYLNSTSETFRELDVRLYDSIDDALGNSCCNDVWAVVHVEGSREYYNGVGANTDGQQPGVRNECSNYFDTLRSSRHAISNKGTTDTKVPELRLTIRMAATSVPDTRNFRWSPLHSPEPRDRSGELLYSLSGFLSMQLEFQTFLRALRDVEFVIHPDVTTANFHSNSSNSNSSSSGRIGNRTRDGGGSLRAPTQQQQPIHSVSGKLGNDTNSNYKHINASYSVRYKRGAISLISHLFARLPAPPRDTARDTSTSREASRDASSYDADGSKVSNRDGTDDLTINIDSQRQLLMKHSSAGIGASHMLLGERAMAQLALDISSASSLSELSSAVGLNQSFFSKGVGAGRERSYVPRPERGQSTVHAPLYHRAFPTHSYVKVSYWYTYAQILVTTLILFFTLPAALCAGSFRKEQLGGHVDMLITLPEVLPSHNGFAWFLCAVLWLLFSFVTSWLYFWIVLDKSISFLPALSLFLSGCAITPLALLMGMIVKKPDALVVAVPVTAFIVMLPGLIYDELVFDVQRSIWLEMFISLSPPSAAALLLRYLCALESLQQETSFASSFPVSHTPVYFILGMLVAECFVYLNLSLWILDHGPHIASFFVLKDHSNQIDNLLHQKVSFEIKDDHSSSENFKFESDRPPPPPKTSKYKLNALEAAASDQVQLDNVLPSDFVDTDVRSKRRESEIFVHSPTADATKGDTAPPSFSRKFDTKCDYDKVVNVEGLGKTYKSAEVLCDINCNLKRGEVTCLLGSNGAGKSTLMRLLCGLDNRYSGHINYTFHAHDRHSPVLSHGQRNLSDLVSNFSRHLGLLMGSSTHQAAASQGRFYSQNLDNSDEEASNTRNMENAAVADRLIGWCPQADALYEQLTVCEHVDLYIKLLHLNTSIESHLGRVGLVPHAHKRASELSGGMRRRLCFLLATMGNPSLILLDEPTSGCDCWSRELIRKEILALAHGDSCSDEPVMASNITDNNEVESEETSVEIEPSPASSRAPVSVLVSTHHMDDVEVVANRVWFLNDKYLVFDGKPDRLNERQDNTDLDLPVSQKSIASHSKGHIRSSQSDDSQYFKPYTYMSGESVSNISIQSEVSALTNNNDRSSDNEDEKNDDDYSPNMGGLKSSGYSFNHFFDGNEDTNIEQPVSDSKVSSSRGRRCEPDICELCFATSSRQVAEKFFNFFPTHIPGTWRHSASNPDAPESTLRGNSHQALKLSRQRKGPREGATETRSVAVHSPSFPLEKHHVAFSTAPAAALSPQDDIWTWRLPDNIDAVLSLVDSLEKAELTSWQLYSPTVEHALLDLYEALAAKDSTQKVNFSSKQVLITDDAKHKLHQREVSFSPNQDIASAKSHTENSALLRSPPHYGSILHHHAAAAVGVDQQSESNKRVSFMSDDLNPLLSRQPSNYSTKAVLYSRKLPWADSDTTDTNNVDTDDATVIGNADTKERDCLKTSVMRIYTLEVLSWLWQVVCSLRRLAPVNQVLLLATQSSIIVYSRICYFSSQKRIWKYIFQQFVVPLLIVLLIAVCCGDVVYPEKEMSSAQMGGLGLVSVTQFQGAGCLDASAHSAHPPLATHTNTISAAAATAAPHSTESAPVTPHTGVMARRKLRRLQKLASDNNGNLLNQKHSTRNSVNNTCVHDVRGRLHDWADRYATGNAVNRVVPISALNTSYDKGGSTPPSTDDDIATKTFAYQYKGYYNSDRLWAYLFGSYYRHGYSDRWFAATVQDSIENWTEVSVTLKQTQLNISAAQLYRRLIAAQNSNCDAAHEDDGTSSQSTPNSLSSARGLTFCNVAIELKPDDRGHQLVVLSMHKTLTTNITLLTNVSSQHASPIYLKDMADDLFFSLTPPVAVAAGGEAVAQSFAPPYQLYSHPLPGIRYSSPVYAERGQLGAICILLYCIITTITCVRHVIQLSSSGFKLQLHLSGMSVIAYWLGNFVCDVSIVALPLLAAYAGVYLGGDPVFGFFFHFTYDLFLRILMAFAVAVCASNYAFCCLSRDSLSSQLTMLLSSVCNGVFLKLFFKKHGDLTTAISFFTFVSPCFVFTTAAFDLFYCYVDMLFHTSTDIKVAGADGSAHNTLDTRHFDWLITVMLLQACAYMLITVQLDAHWTQLQTKRNEWSFACSQFGRNKLIPVARKATENIFACLDRVLRWLSACYHTMCCYGDSHSEYQSVASAEESLGLGGNIEVTNNTSVMGEYKSSPSPGYGSTTTFQSASLYTPSPLKQPDPASSSSAAAAGLYEGDDCQNSQPALDDSASAYVHFPSVTQKKQHADMTDRTVPENGYNISSLRRSNLFTHLVRNESFSASSQSASSCGDMPATGRSDENNSVTHDTDRYGGWDAAFSATSKRSALGIFPSLSELYPDCLSVDEWRHALSDQHRRLTSDRFTALRIRKLQLLPPAITHTSEATASSSQLSGLANDQNAGVGTHNQAAQSSASERETLSLTVQGGECIAVMGLNGCGKTSLFRTLALADRAPLTGSRSHAVKVSGLDMVDQLWTISQRNSLGYVPQTDALLEYLTVEDTLAVFTAITDSAKAYDGYMRVQHRERDEREDNRNRAVGVSHTCAGDQSKQEEHENQVIPSKYNKYAAGTLSGGNKKKLALSVAECGSPPLLLLDECTSGIDPVSANSLVTHLRTHSLARSALFASHRLDECVTLCDRVLLLFEGRVIFDGPMNAFENVTTLFYQLDIRFPRSSSWWQRKHQQEHLISTITDQKPYERRVLYSSQLTRLTLEKSEHPLSRVLRTLTDLKTAGSIETFLLRKMDIEETLTLLIESLSEQQHEAQQKESHG